MGAYFPADIVPIFTSVVTNAVANTTSTTTILAASPGVYYRLWGLWVAAQPNGAAQVARVFLRSGSSTDRYGGVVASVGAHGWHDLSPFGGVPMPVNTAILLEHVDTLAAQTLSTLLYLSIVSKV